MAIYLIYEYDCQFILGIKYWTFFEIYQYHLVEREIK